MRQEFQMILDIKQFFLILISVSTALHAMDKPASRIEKNPEEPTMRPKKRAAAGSKQYDTLTDIKVEPKASQTILSSEIEQLNQARTYFSLLLTGSPLDESHYHSDQALRALVFSRNKATKAEALLMLANLSLFGLGQPQNISEAIRLYNDGLRLETSLSDQLNYYKTIATLLQEIERNLQKQTGSLNTKLSEIKLILESSGYFEDELLNNLTLRLIKRIYPSSNLIQNALYIPSEINKKNIEQLLISNPEYINNALSLINGALFTQDIQLLKNIYGFAPNLKKIMEKVFQEAVLDDKYSDIKMLINAGISQETALILAQKLNKKEMINWLQTPGAFRLDYQNYEQRFMGNQPAFRFIPQKQYTFSEHSLAREPISLNDQFIKAVKQENIPRMERLLTAGAHINYIDARKDSPLMIALKKGNINLVSWLLDRQADPLLAISYDETSINTPLQFVQEGESVPNRDQLKKLLEESMAKKFIGSPVKPAPIPSSSPRKPIPFKGFQEK